MSKKAFNCFCFADRRQHGAGGLSRRRRWRRDDQSRPARPAERRRCRPSAFPPRKAFNWLSKNGMPRAACWASKIELVVADSQCSADPAVNAANKLIDQDKVKYIVGEVCSSASIPVSEIANPKKVVQISPTSTNPTVTVDKDGNAKPYTFRACFIDPFQGLVMAKFAQGKGYKTAFIMYDQGNDYVRGLAEAFEKSFTEMGGQIVGKETYTKHRHRLLRHPDQGGRQPSRSPLPAGLLQHRQPGRRPGQG